MQEVTDQTYNQEVLQSKGKTVVVITGKKCIWCDKLKAVLATVSRPDVKIVEAPKEQCEALRKKYEINMDPVMLFYKDGVLYNCHINAQSFPDKAEEIDAMIDVDLRQHSKLPVPDESLLGTLMPYELKFLLLDLEDRQRKTTALLNTVKLCHKIREIR